LSAVTLEFGTYHLGGGMDDFHLLEDGGTIVSDENFAFGGLDLD